MSNKQTLFPTRAGLDTTTGHGADSFFTTDSPRDPWAARCLSNLIDTIINHKEVVYPLPTRAFIERIGDTLLPLSFVEARKRNWLEIKTDVSTDEVQLSSGLLASEYKNFIEWARQNALELAALIEYQKLPHLREIRQALVPTQLVDEFWATRRDDELSRQIDIPDADLKTSFDAFARGVQYHRVLGDTIPYFPHPIRDHALGFLPTILHHQNQWSWGRYFVQLTEQERAPRDIEWLLDRVSPVRDLARKYNATWYALGQRPRHEQLELLSTIASESDLPAKLKDPTGKAIRTALEVGAVISFAVPVVSVVLGLGVVAVELWSGEVPGWLSKISALKGHLLWPGLMDKPE